MYAMKLAENQEFMNPVSWPETKCNVNYHGDTNGALTREPNQKNK